MEEEGAVEKVLSFKDHVLDDIKSNESDTGRCLLEFLWTSYKCILLVNRKYGTFQ